MAVRIIKRRDGIYDVYDRTNVKWLFSRCSADNIFAWLSEQKIVYIDFIDETIQL